MAAEQAPVVDDRREAIASALSTAQSVADAPTTSKDTQQAAEANGGCSSCGGKRTSKNRYCLTCSNAYMRQWRKTHRLSGKSREKMNARSYANMYFRRGKIAKMPCKQCGSAHSQMHHPDYSQPLNVEWLCRTCHLAEHRGVANAS